MEFGIKIQDGGDAQRSVGVGNATTPLHVAVVVVVSLLNKCPLSYVSGMIAAVCAILKIRITEFAQRTKSERTDRNSDL